jgi:histidyl-tRNA synthetase
MKNELKAIRGIKDIIPGEVEKWQYLENISRSVFESYGYSEIKIPIIEKTDLFSRSIGESSDIVEKEMYTFPDRKGNMISLRPEGTASVVRAYLENRIYMGDPVSKLYYIGPMFRYERPQMGRYRQFYQIGVEVFGIEGSIIDAEIISIIVNILNKIGIKEIEVHINSLGCGKCRKVYRESILEILMDKMDILCEDCKRRVKVNPLRILDCKKCKEIKEYLPSILDFICQGCLSHFNGLKNYLNELNIKYVVDPMIIRGLDYYTRTTFEIISNRLGAQNALAAGGRYDGLVKELGGPDIPGIGFAMGIERVVSLMPEGEYVKHPVVFIAYLGKEAEKVSFNIINQLREAGIKTEMGYDGKSLKSQMRKADKLRVKYTIIIGDDELKNRKVILRDMITKDQEKVNIHDIKDTVTSKINRITN